MLILLIIINKNSDAPLVHTKYVYPNGDNNIMNMHRTICQCNVSMTVWQRQSKCNNDYFDVYFKVNGYFGFDHIHSINKTNFLLNMVKWIGSAQCQYHFFPFPFPFRHISFDHCLCILYIVFWLSEYAFITFIYYLKKKKLLLYYVLYARHSHFDRDLSNFYSKLWKIVN